MLDIFFDLTLLSLATHAMNKTSHLLAVVTPGGQKHPFSPGSCACFPGVVMEK